MHPDMVHTWFKHCFCGRGIDVNHKSGSQGHLVEEVQTCYKHCWQLSVCFAGGVQAWYKTILKLCARAKLYNVSQRWHEMALGILIPFFNMKRLCNTTRNLIYVAIGRRI